MRSLEDSIRVVYESQSLSAQHHNYHLLHRKTVPFMQHVSTGGVHCKDNCSISGNIAYCYYFYCESLYIYCTISEITNI